MSLIQTQQALNLQAVKFLPHFIENAGMENYTGDLIARRLAELDKTQEWLAEKVGVSINAVSKWTRTGRISRDNAKLAAKALGVSVGALLQEEVETVPTVKKVDNSGIQLVYLTGEELNLVTAFREATEIGRAMLVAAATAVPKNNKSEQSGNQA